MAMNGVECFRFVRKMQESYMMPDWRYLLCIRTIRKAVLVNKEAILQHAQNGGLFGVEKMRWAAYVESNPLKKVEELLEDDYGMIDGIINNGSKQEKENETVEKNKSVMEKLSEGREAVKKYERENTPEQPKKTRPEREV